MPYKLTTAVINAEVTVAFEQSPANVVKLSGVVKAGNVTLQDKPGSDLLGFDQLKITMDDVRPLAQSVKLAGVALTNPLLNISRSSSGRLNLIPAAEADAPKSGAASAQEIRAAALNDTQKASQGAGSGTLPADTATNAPLINFGDCRSN